MSETENTEIIIQELTETGILRLTLNDYSRRNALSEAMLERLSEIMNSSGSDSSVRVIVLSANGPAFCAGHDLKELTASRANADKGEAYFAKIMSMCAQMMQAIVNNPKPVIAEVTGIATAAGCQLVASCDLAYAAETSKFSTPGVHIGLFCSTPMVALSRNLSNKHAMEMLLTGEMLAAQRAAEIGLINRSVSAEDLTETTMAVASTIASKSSMTLTTGKKAFYTQRQMPLAEAYNYASRIMVENMMKYDAEEGINAFIEKRPASWQNR
jgi:enoyl-CoA hydratase/carnithine racemase